MCSQLVETQRSVTPGARCDLAPTERKTYFPCPARKCAQILTIHPKRPGNLSKRKGFQLEARANVTEVMKAGKIFISDAITWRRAYISAC